MYEKVSIRSEQEQEIIKDSVSIDWDKQEATAYLALRADPEKHLNDNKRIAYKRLQNVVKKYGGEQEVLKSIAAAFEKLSSKGYMARVRDLSAKEQEMLKDAQLCHYLCWDIAFNPKSLSTPARPVMDASSNTPGGTNLNDICVKGTPQLVNLLSLLLGWVVGPVAITGDASSFYNCVKLHPSHWTYQRLLLYEDLDPTKEVIDQNSYLRGCMCKCSIRRGH